MKIINLDKNVLNALDFFCENKVPKLDISKFDLPFVVGSGNAYNTGAIIFSKKTAVFADESNFKNILKSYTPLIQKKIIKDAIIISASGGKDSVWEIKLAKKQGLKTTLLTCNVDSEAAKFADKVIGYRKIAEPYTYNFSTYLGMMLSTTTENPEDIRKMIKKLKIKNNFKKYTSFSFVLPDRFLNICSMLNIKQSELFGPMMVLRAFSRGHARHAKYVIPSEKELVINIGEKTKYFGHKKSQLYIPLPKNANFGTVLSLCYYIVGQIQESKPGYFKKNIANYCKNYGPKAYGKTKPFEIIVPGN